MSFTGPDIRQLRQRLGWSLAEMARQMGCGTELLKKWEAGSMAPDADAMNQLRYLRNHVEVYNDEIQQKPVAEREMDARNVAQLTHRDLLKDN